MTAVHLATLSRRLRICQRTVFGCFVALVAITTAHGADVAFYSVNKGILFRQTNAAGPVIRGGLPYVFESLVFPVANPLVTSARVQWSVADVAMQPITTPPALAFVQRLATQEALDGTFPNGDYRVLMQTVNDGSRTGRVSIAGNAYPAPPLIQGYAALQTIDPSVSQAVQWNAFLGGTVADFIHVQIENSQGRVFATGPAPGLSGALDGTATRVVLPPNTLQAGRAYVGRITFFKYGAFNVTDYPGVSGTGGYFSQTDFELRTQGAGDVTPPTLVATAPNNGATNVPINAPVMFQFSEPMSRGIALGISGTSAGRTFEWSADSSTLVATPTTNWPANTTITWTLNLFYTQLGFGDANGNPLPMETILTFRTGSNAVPVIAPVLVEQRRLPNGRFQFRVVGETNRAYVVQGSTNVSTWTSLVTNVAFGGSFEFSDASAPELPHRAYRALAP